MFSLHKYLFYFCHSFGILWRRTLHKLLVAVINVPAVICCFSLVSLSLCDFIQYNIQIVHHMWQLRFGGTAKETATTGVDERNETICFRFELRKNAPPTTDWPETNVCGHSCSKLLVGHLVGIVSPMIVYLFAHMRQSRNQSDWFARMRTGNWMQPKMFAGRKV